MELLGIVLSVPVAFVCSMLYCALLAKVIARFQKVSRFLYVISALVLILFVLELVLLVTLGAVRSRGLFGPTFYVVHIALFFLVTPALASVLILRRSSGLLRTWYVAGVICTAFAFFLVLLQYSVSESLYGIDGENGPYSSISIPPEYLRPFAPILGQEVLTSAI
jgi:hypothetical protein